MTGVCFRVAENRLWTDGCAGKNLRPAIIMILAEHQPLAGDLVGNKALRSPSGSGPGERAKPFLSRSAARFAGDAQIHQMMNRLGETIACPKSCRIDS